MDSNSDMPELPTPAPGIDRHSGQRTGEVLAAARTAKGIELVDIAKETRVPLRHLKALEADDHELLPALPYAIGFVKNFAQYVGLDPETIAAQFRAETSKLAHVPSPLSMEPLDERRLPSRSLVMASIAIIVLVIAGLSAWGAGVFDSAPVVNTKEIAVAEPSPPMSANPDVTPDQGIAAAPLAASAAAPVAAGIVVLTATEDVWVKIYDRATRANAKIGILKSGESYAVPADRPGLLLWTGKAGALAITVGGRPVAPLGGPVETVRDISLAAADLAARPMPGAPVVAAPLAAGAPGPAAMPPTATPGV